MPRSRKMIFFWVNLDVIAEDDPYLMRKRIERLRLLVTWRGLLF
jgi:hypothetical protein